MQGKIVEVEAADLAGKVCLCRTICFAGSIQLDVYRNFIRLIKGSNRNTKLSGFPELL
jgi:hypothetical protein